MNMVKLCGNVDENGQMSCAGPLIDLPWPCHGLGISRITEEDAHFWSEGVAREWADELDESAQDIYTMADGERVREPFIPDPECSLRPILHN